VTLTLRPPGRGNWRPLVMQLAGHRGALFIRVGQTIFLGGVTWRISKISP
jgi:hypothetical protein